MITRLETIPVVGIAKSHSFTIFEGRGSGISSFLKET